eukprot:s256_g17.t1
MNSVSYKAVMGSCERWEQWGECMRLLVDQHLGGIKASFGAFALPFLASKSKWGVGLSQLLRNVRDQRLDFDAAHGAVVSSTTWKWSMLLLRESTGLVDLDCMEVSKSFFDGGVEWSLASLLLSELQEMHLQSDSEACFSLASSLCRKGMWWKSLHMSQELGQLGVTSEVLVLNSFSTALQWSQALAALGRMEPPGLVDYDVLVMACWKCEENVLATQLLRESQGLRSPVSFLWGLSVIHEADPRVIHAACVDAWVALREATRPSDFDLITAWRASAVLGAGNERFHQFLVERVRDRLPKLTLEELSFAVQGAASTTAPVDFYFSVQDRGLEFLRDAQVDLSFSKDGQEILSMVFACKIAGGEISFVSSLFLRVLRAALQRRGRSMDRSDESRDAVREQSVVPSDKVEVQMITTGGADRPVLLKPPGDVEHNYGFLHRLDVPSSGLILLARSYEAFYDLQLQLYSGLMVREYTVLCHGCLMCGTRKRTYSSSETFLADAQICERNWLHRHRLTFRDVDGEVCEVSCELPPDLRRSLAMLALHRSAKTGQVRLSSDYGGALAQTAAQASIYVPELQDQLYKEQLGQSMEDDDGWLEVQSPSGRIYYWNQFTYEEWDPPAEDLEPE